MHLRRVKIGLTGLALGLFGVLMLLLAVMDLAGGGEVSGRHYPSIACNVIKDTTPEALLDKAEVLRAVAAQNAARAPEGSGVI